MKKCAVCQKGKARRECLLKEGALICSRCCAELRGEPCGDCPHYADILRYQAERWREGSLPEGHFIAEINPDAQQGVDDALALAEKGRMDEATEDMERLVRDYPQCYDVYYGMGTLHGMQGHHEESILWFEKCMAIFPYFAEAHFNMGVAYQKSYQLEKAVRANRKAMDYGDPAEEYYGHAKSFLEDMAKMIRKNNGVDLDTYL
ncbi:MAG: hypothetical protein KAU94_06725, partial [Verrucomicrobia bacterium]|nr:hypothetical protein [Verrucomicrobiota bacterium]